MRDQPTQLCAPSCPSLRNSFALPDPSAHDPTPRPQTDDIVGADLVARCARRGSRLAPNPKDAYLAFAAALASGLDGIINEIEPPDIFEGDVYAARHLPRVPHTLKEATDLFEQSPFVAETLGSEVARHYTHFFRTEQQAFDAFVTDWERRRYFERI